MPPGTALDRLLAMHEGEVIKMRDRFSGRAGGHDDVQHSPAEKLASFLRGGRPLWTARAEPMAHFASEVGMLRWWWHGRVTQIPSRLDSIVAEGRAWDVSELVDSAASLHTLERAERVCAAAASIAGAEGYLCLPRGEDWEFFALYDAPGARMTIPAPPQRSVAPPPAAHAGTTLPPPPVAPAPAVPAPVREPPRELVSPVAGEVMRDVQAALPGGFQQAMLTVVIDAQGPKARLFVHLAAADPVGDLHALDPSQTLFDAVVTMVTEHRRQGGGALRKLVLRLRRSERGGAIDVRVA